MSGSLIRDTPPWARMSAGTRSSAITATAPASSAILACSAVTTSMMTPPLSISAMPRLTRAVPVAGVISEVGSADMQTIVRRAPGPVRFGSRGQAAGAASACLRTTQTRWTTVTVLATASTHSAIGSRIGRSSSTLEAGHHQDRHQPVGPLGDADLGVEAQRLRAGPGVRRDRSHHQADQREPQVEAVVPGPGEVERQPGEDRPVADPVERGVQERAEQAGPAGQPGHVAVDQVAEDERGDDQDAGRAAGPAGKNAQRTGARRRWCRPA